MPGPSNGALGGGAGVGGGSGGFGMLGFWVYFVV